MSDDHISAQEFGELKGTVGGLCREIKDMRGEMRLGFQSLEAKMPTECGAHKARLDDHDKDIGEVDEKADKAYRRVNKMLGNILKIIIPIFLAMAGGLFYLAMYLSAGSMP